MKRRRIVFFLLWILSLVGITFFGGTISYGLFWTMTFIPILSLFYLLMVFVQFRVYQEIESRTVVSKQPTPYYLFSPMKPFILLQVSVYDCFQDFLMFLICLRMKNMSCYRGIITPIVRNWYVNIAASMRSV